MNELNFFRSHNGRNWIEECLKVSRWVKLAFPSSRSLSRLFVIDEFVLPSGARATHVAVTSMMDYGEMGAIRGVSLIFATGELRSHLCSTKLTFFLNEADEIFHVIVGEHEGGDGDWRIGYDHSYANGSITDPWRFEKALSIVVSVVGILQNKTGVEVAPQHPLLNRHRSSAVSIVIGKDGS